MNGFAHQTVLRRETASLLAAAPGRVILDGTLGGGGHAQALLDAGARVVGLDQDPAAIAAARARLSGRDIVVAHGNFRDARALLDQLGVSEVDGALVDLGVSSPQLDEYGGRVSDSGEGRWTVQAAVEEGVPAPVLAASLFDRFASRGEADWGNRVLSAMRKGFGGHLEKSPEQ